MDGRLLGCLDGSMMNTQVARWKLVWLSLWLVGALVRVEVLWWGLGGEAVKRDGGKDLRTD